jgi:hypothetical protein
MKKNTLNTIRKTFLAPWAAGCAAAGLMLCGNLTQAQPVINSSLISLPNAPDGTSIGEAVGAVQFQGAAPSANQLQFTVTSGTQNGVTALAVTLTATNLPGVVTTSVLTPTSGLSISGSPTSETVTVPLANDTQYHAVISATDSNGTTSATIAHFDTINPLYFTFEAEDFDYSGGLFVDSLPAGTYQNVDIYGSSYGLLVNDIAETGIDAQHPFTSGQTDLYRATALNVASDLTNATCATGSAGDTPRYQYVTSGLPDYEVGYNSNSDWANYTRHYPQGVYNIYLRGAAGSTNTGSPFDLNESDVGLVTSGWGTTNQTTNHIGSFSPLYVGGYNSYSWAPAIDTNGALAAWVAAGDQETLRITVARAQANYNCYMLVPAVPIITPNNTNVFQGSAVTLGFFPYALSAPSLQWQSDNGSGGTTWSNIGGATSTNYILNTGSLSLKPYEYQVVLTVMSNRVANGSPIAITVTSAPVILNVLAPSAPVLVSSPTSVSEILNANTALPVGNATFVGAFTGSPTLTYQWYVSSNSGGVFGAFTPIVGSNGTTLTVVPTYAVQTNEYMLVASNGVAPFTNATAPATLTIEPVPPLQIAGDLIVELRSADLVPTTGGTITTWTNRSGSGNSVSNFHRSTASNVIEVSNNATSTLLQTWSGMPVNAVLVNSSSTAVESILNSPAELVGNGTETGEAWFFQTSLPSGNNTIIGQGIQGQSGLPEEDREMNWGSGGAGTFSGDFGGLDCAWPSSLTTGGDTAMTNKWYYLAWTWDGTTARGYVNGVIQTTHTLGAGGTFGSGYNGYPLHTVDTDIGVGVAFGTGNGSFADNASGTYIASVRVSSGVLTPGQVANNYLSGLLAQVPVTVSAPTITSNITTLVQGTNYTLTGAITTNVAFPYTYQWEVNYAGGGYTVIPGATNLTYAIVTAGLTPGVYQYELVVSDSAQSIVEVSSPITVTVIVPQLEIVQDITPNLVQTYVTLSTNLSVNFSGQLPISYQWQISANDTTWSNLTNTTTNLLVNSLVPATNYYRLIATNAVAPFTNVSSVAEVIWQPALALPAFLPVQTSGDVIVDLENSGLVASLASGSGVWSNLSTAPVSVGNFSSALNGGTNSNGAPVLNISTSGSPYFYNQVDALFVNGQTTNALESAVAAPAEIVANKSVSAETWVYALTLPNNNTTIAYGDQAQNMPQQTDREFDFAAGSASSGDFGSFDSGWANAATVVTAGTWHYCAWTYAPTATGGTLLEYLDGALNTSHSVTSTNDTIDTVVCIGGGIGMVPTPLWSATQVSNLLAGEGGILNTNVATDTFHGYIGAARLESGILTAAQISNNYVAGMLGIIPIALGPGILSPVQSTPSGVTNAIDAGSPAFVSSIVEVTNAQYPVTFQWYTDNGTFANTGTATYTAIPGATSTNYTNVTSTVGSYLFELVATNAAKTVGAVSAPVVVNVIAATGPTIVNDISPSGFTSTYVTVSTVFSASFSGAVPLLVQWQVSSNGVNWTSIVGSNGPTLTITPLVPGTNYYRLEGSNSIGVAYSSEAGLIAQPALALPAPGGVTVVGDLIVNLQASDLKPGATAWFNRTSSANSVGDFTAEGGGALNVITVNFVDLNGGFLGAGGDGDYNPINVLNVNSVTANSVVSELLTPSEINGSGPSTFEAWVYSLSVVSQAAVISYGQGGGSSLPGVERDFGYGTAGYAAWTGNFGNQDTGWSVTPTVGWHYLAATYNGASIVVYQDGVANTSSDNPGSIPTSQSYLSVGSADTSTSLTAFGLPFNGYIASARVMNGVLSASQIAANFDAGPFGTVPASYFPVPVPVLTSSFTGKQITLTWPPSAILVSSTTVNGPWTAVAGATSPYVITPAVGTPALFYTIEQP